MARSGDSTTDGRLDRSAGPHYDRRALKDAYAEIIDHDTYVNDVPHETFARLRREEPVAWIDEKDGSGFWAVTRYADIVEVSKEFQRFTCTRGIRLEEMDEEELEARRSMMEHDPPEHSRLRRIVQPSVLPQDGR